MQIGISKHNILEMKRGKFVQSEGIELPNGEMRKLPEVKKGDKFLIMLQFDCVKSKEMKDNDNKGILPKD